MFQTRHLFHAKIVSLHVPPIMPDEHLQGCVPHLALERCERCSALQHHHGMGVAGLPNRPILYAGPLQGDLPRPTVSMQRCWRILLK